MPTKQECETCSLKSRCIYSVLTKEQRSVLQFKKVFNRKKKGTILFQEGFPAYALFMLIRGVIKHSKVGRSDREIFIGFRMDGDLAGLVSVTPNSLYPATGVGITDIAFCTIPSDVIRHFLSQNTKVADYLFMMFGEVIYKVGERIGELVECSTQQRVARTLVLLNKYVVEGHKGFELKREDLATLTGSTRETVSRILGKLKRDKIISIQNSYIVIVKPQRLTEMSKF